MIEKAYAKINLSIDVCGVLPNGYHELDMLVLPIDLYDELSIEISDQDDYQSNIPLPYDAGNIIYRCIEKLRETVPFSQRFRIRLTKNIPMGAGLGGGSSDGAAALKLVNQLCRLGLSTRQLAQIGAKVGADIPSCVYGRPSRVQGIGEVVKPFEMNHDLDVLLIKPAASIDTKEAYERLDLTLAAHPDIDALQNALVHAESLEQHLGNSLLQSSAQLVEEIETIMAQAQAAGFREVMMSGSGSTVFAICPKGSDTKEFEKQMKEKYPFVLKTKTLRS